MSGRVTSLLLRWLRVPPEPHPPHGDPASLRVFRAGPSFLKLRLLKWGLAQIVALVGIIFWFGVFSDLEKRVEEIRAQQQRPPPAPTAPATPAPPATESVAAATPPAEAAPKPRRKRRSGSPLDGFRAWQHGTATALAQFPPFAVKIIWVFEIGGMLLYVLQLPVTLLIARLDYELRWYMITDRSLRLRHGIWKITESTMSFANIQQVVVSQGPLQRLLGLSDVKVQSAGGGGGDKDESAGKEDDMHLGLFHSVTNPTEIRDLILERLRRFRESGLGDPEEKAVPLANLATASASAEALPAAQELLAEVRALRSALN